MAEFPLTRGNIKFLHQSISDMDRVEEVLADLEDPDDIEDVESETEDIPRLTCILVIYSILTPI